MTVPAFHVEAKLHAFRKTQEGVVVSFVVSPIDMPSELALDPLGTRYMLALAQIGDDEQPVPPAGNPQPQAGKDETPPKPAGEPKSPAERAVIRAALLPKDEGFRTWWANSLGWPALRLPTEEEAAQHIRHTCGVKSRAEIANNKVAFDRFLNLETEYLIDVGKMARPR